MRIALAFFQTQARGGNAANYGFWSDMMRAALQEAGHEVLEFADIDWAAGMCPGDGAALRAWRDRSWSLALQQLEQWRAAGGVDFFLAYFFPQQIEPAAVAEIRRRGIPIVNFFCDNVREFRHVPTAFRDFDLHWVPEWAALPLYVQAGLPHLHAPMPLWIPPGFRSVAAQEDAATVCFLGTYDPQRAGFLAELAPHGVRVQIRGKGWQQRDPTPAGFVARDYAGRLRHQCAFINQHGLAAWLRKFSRTPAPVYANPPADWCGGPVPRDEYLRLTREAAVTLGINRYESPRLRPGEIAVYSRLRDIEAPMLGACYLTEWAPGLNRLYDLDREIATYRDAAGLADAAGRLLADPARRAAMRSSAQRRALQDHSIAATIGKIIRQLGLAAPA